MRITCPNCAETYPIEAGFADSDGKRLAVLFAEMEPALGRAVINYLRLFKPPKSALRTVRAIKIVAQLLDLVRTGTVCRDERSGLRRPASHAMWAAGIDQMLAAPGKLTLPLGNHHYLRAIVFGIADQADAHAERAHEQQLRTPSRGTGQPADIRQESPLEAMLAWLRQQRDYGLITPDDYKAQAAAARAKQGGPSDG